MVEDTEKVIPSVYPRPYFCFPSTAAYIFMYLILLQHRSLD
uniref:Uncharacterized protein n=1 Tax=Anguilla anguilla TaxID=7936 RepID=A0A0E9P8D5_ANGAN